ncbi:oxysterol-binding protein-related protein 11 [Sabethes cyaneus]|uniref:oxysterol-binding protein-related protein 11 n=1 Tax=Sabethes cyaneus TaxID=53552 RepID=UPI00237DC2D1|nr:oxysterol-binding protein-related protein 11 [Sabethes cyaneus]XP_053683770.1 oxysterol-binding protein-related protein 11 [Sabethes cyaneus]
MESNLSRILNMNRQQLNGQLYKYTNVMKGWQYRWFVVDAQAGLLSYYLCDQSNDDTNPHIVGNSPRGQVHLAGAVICPSDEDSKTFTVNCASGDMLKLRAGDARARQEWVDGLRAIVESHSNSATSLAPRDQLAAHDAFGAARQQMQQTELSNAALARAIESVSNPLLPTDPDLLMLKALSAASTHCLLQCLGLLQRYNEFADTRNEPAF